MEAPVLLANLAVLATALFTGTAVYVSLVGVIYTRCDR